MAEIYGRNPVLEALRAGSGVSAVLVAQGVKEVGPLAEILRLAHRAGVPVQTVERSALDRRTHSGIHQGVVAVLKEFAYASLDEVYARAGSEPLFVLVVDSVQDPQNLGALLRSAEAAGVHGVILPLHRAADISAVVEKASAGAARLVPVVQVTNLVQTLKELKDRGAWVVGVENDPAAQPYDEADLAGPLALVVGSEGQGLGRLVRATCDFLIRLPMRGRISSLNVAIAGSIVLYRALSQRGRPASNEEDH